MTNLLNLPFAATPEEMKKGPKVYFRGVNRIHINRFKAYVHILSNRLRYKWQVTDDISKSSAIISYDEENDSESAITLSLYAEQPNLNPPAIGQYKLVFDEESLIKLLNLAGRKLSLAKKEIKENQNISKKKIKVSSFSQSLSKQFCDQLESLSERSIYKFINSPNLLDDDSMLFVDHLLFVVDPSNESSKNAYFKLEQLKAEGLTINELTVIIVKHENQDLCEDVFDEIYDDCDESTQVIMIDLHNQEDVKNFVGYL